MSTVTGRGAGTARRGAQPAAGRPMPSGAQSPSPWWLCPSPSCGLTPTAKTLLFLAAIGFSAGNFHVPSDPGGHQEVVWIVIAVILAAGIALALIGLVPRLRRMASRQIRPHLLNIWETSRRSRLSLARFLRPGRLHPGPAPRHPGPGCIAARSRGAREHRHPDHRQHAGRHRRRRGTGTRRRRCHRGRADHRAYQRRHPFGAGGRRGVHPAALHGLPAPDLGLGHPGLDAPPRIRYNRDGTELIGQTSKSPWTLDTHRGTCSRPASSPCPARKPAGGKPCGPPPGRRPAGQEPANEPAGPIRRISHDIA